MGSPLGSLRVLTWYQAERQDVQGGDKDKRITEDNGHPTLEKA